MGNGDTPAPRWAPMVESSTVVDWMAAAQNTIRAYCGWHVAPSITETLIVDGNGERIMQLPSAHVTDVQAVRFDGVDVTDRIRWSTSGLLEIPGHRGRFPTLLRSVAVELTHGYEPVDVPEVITLIAELAKRGKSNPGAIASKAVNGASVGYMSAGGAPLSIPLTYIEKEALNIYKIGWLP